MTDEFEKAFGTTQHRLSRLLLKVHDAAPNREKRRWELLSKATEGTLEQGAPNLALLAETLRDAALNRLNEMIARVQGTDGVLTHDQARSAVHATDVGSALSEVLEMAERAAVEAAPLSKRIEASLTEKECERRLMDKARQVQFHKACEGQPISLLTAIDIAKAAG
ncbi:MAG: hypothetical protein AAF340_06440 [Pseudomonadota bacterium]